MSNIIDKIQLSGVTYTLSGTSSGGTEAVEVTQAEYDALVSGGTVDPTVFYIITDATPIDVSTFVTSGQMTSAITQATSGKVDSSSIVSSVTSASTDSEIPTAKAVFDAIPTGGTGGGKAISAGTNISVTTGETADTINCTLPLSYGTSPNRIVGGNMYNLNIGQNNSLSTYLKNSFVVGQNNKVIGSGSINAVFIAGFASSANSYSCAVGMYLNANNQSEHSVGQYNVSSSASTTFGNSGNTLFSVGNGTANNARHNAFEIRQNGDIYLSSGGTDIKLQDYLGGGGSITIDPSLDSGSTNAVANSAITEAVNSKVNISDNNVSAFSGVQLAIAESTYYGDKDVRTIYIKSIGDTQYTDKLLCIVRFGNSNSSTSFNLSGSTSVSYGGGTITAYTIDDTRVTSSLDNGVITVTFNDTSYHLLSVENVVKDIGIYYTKGGYSSGQTADVVENTVYDVLTELGENLVNNNNNNNNYVTLDTAQDITATKTFVNTDKGIIFKQKQKSNKIGFSCQSSASTNNEIATFEFRPNTYTDSSNVKHPLLYLGHYRSTNVANNGIVQTMVGFRQYDQSGSAAYHYLIPLPAEAKTPFSLTASFKNYFAPLGFKNGDTMITTDNTGVADFSSVLGGLKLVKLTQSAYDALTTKDDNTVYFIGDSTNGYTMKIGSANVN